MSPKNPFFNFELIWFSFSRWFQKSKFQHDTTSFWPPNDPLKIRKSAKSLPLFWRSWARWRNSMHAILKFSSKWRCIWSSFWNLVTCGATGLLWKFVFTYIYTHFFSLLTNKKMKKSSTLVFVDLSFRHKRKNNDG